MTKQDCRIGTPVTFGRTNGAVAHGVVIKCNPAKAHVCLTAQWNSHPVGRTIVVPYAMLHAVVSSDDDVMERAITASVVGTTVTPSRRDMHPELGAFMCEGGMFDVEPCALDLLVGKRGMCVDADLEAHGTQCLEPFTIVGVQKNYRGDKCLRVVHDGDKAKFGRVLNPATEKFELFN